LVFVRVSIEVHLVQSLQKFLLVSFESNSIESRETRVLSTLTHLWAETIHLLYPAKLDAFVYPNVIPSDAQYDQGSV